MYEARAHARLGSVDEAFAALERAYQEHEPTLSLFKTIGWYEAFAAIHASRNSRGAWRCRTELGTPELAWDWQGCVIARGSQCTMLDQ